MAQQPKPKLFIGSAKESIRYASAVHKALSHFAEISPWYAGTFHAMNYTMEDLEAKLGVSDFAVFIFSPDDLVVHRGTQVLAPRDNTVFEMGMFWGKLKRGRVFFIVPESVERQYHKETIKEFHVLSDMQGLSLLKYEIRSDEDYDAAVSVPCMDIGKKITAMGKFEDPQLKLDLAEAELERNESLLHFFLQLSKALMNDSGKRYESLYDAIRIAYVPVGGYRVVGAAVWKANQDGLEQVAGNVGRSKSYPFSVNDGKTDGRAKIHVIDSFLNSVELIVLLNDHVVKTYLLCYPVGKDLIIVIHIAGKRLLEQEEMDKQLEQNEKLMSTIHYLFGGDTL